MPKKFQKEDRSRKVSTSSQRSGESGSRPLTSSDSEEPIELLSPKHNGNSVDGSIKPHNKSSIKGMWKKAFRSIRSDKTSKKDGGEKDKTDAGDRDSKHSRTPLRTFRRQESTDSTNSSRQSSLKRVLRRKDSKEEKPPGEEEYSRDEDPVYMCLKRAASIAVPGSVSGDTSHPGSLDIVDEELYDDPEGAPAIRPSSSSYRSSYHDYQ